MNHKSQALRIFFGGIRAAAYLEGLGGAVRENAMIII